MAPTVMMRARVFYRHPTFGVISWLSLFAFGALAAAFAVFLAVWSVFETWLVLGNEKEPVNWFEAISVAFAPWVLLAVGGISIALVNDRLADLFAPEVRVDLSALGGRPVAKHLGYSVVELPLPIAHIGSSSRERVILQTSGARTLLSEAELLASWQHEAAHLRLHHGRVTAVVNLVDVLFKRFAATQALKREVTLLLELIADRAVTDRTSAATALAKLRGGTPEREVQIRLVHLAE